jgi:hypothetical protein
VTQYAKGPLVNDVKRANFRAPTSRDLETPLSYLKYIENVFRMYARNEIGWQDVRDTLASSPDVIAGFEQK